MSDLTLEIRSACEKKIAILQQEIDRLREGMAIVISALQENSGDQDASIPKELKPIHRRKINRQPFEGTKLAEAGAPNTRKRVKQAIDQMPPSGFGTAELLKRVNLDGNTKPVNKNRALRIFNDLVNSGEIKVLKKRSGSQGGIYSKITKESSIEPSQAKTAVSLF